MKNYKIAVAVTWNAGLSIDTLDVKIAYTDKL